MVYQEEVGGSFESDGVKYDLNKIFARTHSSPVSRVALADLKWVLQHSTPGEQRRKAANTSVPIIVTPYGSRTLTVDGLHRIGKGLEEGKTHLPAKWLSKKDLEESRMNAYLEKAASMFQRAKYNADTRLLNKMSRPAASIKYDGANYFIKYDQNGVPSFISRKKSVTGETLDRTAKVPHLAKVLPQEAGNVYNVELIHTGFDPKAKESHPKVSGILNSLAPKAIATQQEIGPLRAVVFNVMEPQMATYEEKIAKMKQFAENFGNPDLVFPSEHHYGHEAVAKLIASTKARKLEGVIVHDLDAHESSNTRLKIKHVRHYNLRVHGIEQEEDIHGNLKQSAGSLILADATGKIVGKVGSGLTKAIRKDIWDNPHEWINKHIQVEAMEPTAHKLRFPVYNGDADGELDEV